jgi:hypothetical protein
MVFYGCVTCHTVQSCSIDHQECPLPDSVTITIAALNMEGVDAVDPQVTVDILQAAPLQRIISRQIIHNFSGKSTIAVPSPDDFPTWQVNVSFSRYDGVSGFFFQPRGEPSPTYKMQVTRLPGAWKPQFTPLESLAAPRFQTFRNIVAVSTNVDLKNGPAVGDLSAKYDMLADGSQIQAKTALLNLFAVLTDEQDPIGKVPWFSYVRKIVRIDQERFIAEVDPTLFENVQTILNGLNGAFKGQGYFTEPDSDLLLRQHSAAVWRQPEHHQDDHAEEGLRAGRSTTDDGVHDSGGNRRASAGLRP